MYKIAKNSADPKLVLGEIQKTAEENGKSFTRPVHWHITVAPLKSISEAEKWLDANDGEPGHCHAVRFQCPATENTEEIFVLKHRAAEAATAYRKLNFESMPKVARTAEFIGCPSCGSKLARRYLSSNHCPLCNTDLRSKTVLDRLAGYQRKIHELNTKIDKAEQKAQENTVVKWLIKYEYDN